MFEPIYETTQDAVIKVVGVGGGGGNALNHMVDGNLNNEGVGGVEFFSVNTDAQVLRTSSVRQTIQIGANITKGLGAGANPNVGRQAAEEDREALSNMLAGADMVFISAGMGGGTGTGAAPVIADIAKSQGSLTVAIVTKPFRFEGNKRMSYAEQGIQELSKHVDSLIIIPNDKLLKVLPKNTKMMDAFKAANDILRNAVLGITDMITSPGLINVDFADVKTVMSEMGRAMMGTGIAEGEDRAERAAHDAVASPLLEDVDLSGAKGILVSISSGLDIELNEVDVIMDYIHSFAASDATIVFGTSVYPEMDGKLRVTLVATGIGQAEELTLPRTPVLQQQVQQHTQAAYQPQAQPAQPAFAQPQQGYTQQPAQFSQSQSAAPKPQQVDSSQVWSPNSIPGFMRNGQ
ncbi:cell division protein FtsZ [Actinobacillus equuli subsp. equuli]|uniref:Cell division protein FtsZ n=1 Tax=Actinobacillus equuli TaxID=718 RepID=A0AAX3FHQ5_ACTEU|nr:cell division protein FtsZ [Actinobacillus equuli]AIZ79593.1 cell division protein FtsZ [Actinobacillus equuli subsp. equuli]MDG4952827.1 cell division protein FtsZ [Actinobacillus equuli subsp. equuli]WGE43706.1 cell division protein FtsZ [Actinobacillus equuli subsp. equuli]WGE47957.1 cell division protein FtsZ [Actinobacillus equuli subsp. equuli]WGE50048.1 cell division protein FtsZ [Actinobacillus equuli subsp. haemolyticus]